MTVVPPILALLVSTISGWMLVAIVWPPARQRELDRVLRGCLAVGLGLGITSCTTYAWLNVPGHGRGLLVAFDLVVLAVLGVGHHLVRRRTVRAPGPAAPPTRQPAIRWLPPVAGGAVLLFSVALGGLLVVEPHGRWDAWASWNLRARFLFRGGDDWAAAFHPALAPTRLEYPLLLPLTVTRLWAYQGSDSTLAPRIVALAFVLATFGALFGLLRVIKSADQAYLGILVLTATPAFVHQGASQLADVPLSFFLLCAIGLMALARTGGDGDPRLLFLSGTALGYAAWTKNEGQLMLLCGIVAVLAAGLFGDRPGPAWTPVWHLVLGATPSALLIALKQYQFPAVNDLMGVQNRATIAQAIDPSRHGQILRHVWERILADPQYVIIAVLAVAAIALGWGGKTRAHPPVAASALTLSMTAAGFYVIYLITPHPLDWHLTTSARRLLLQLWPSVVLVVLLIARALEDVATVAASTGPPDPVSPSLDRGSRPAAG